MDAGDTKSSNSTELEEANQFKLRANECFKNQKFEDAIELYTKAIELKSDDPTFYGNRSFAYLKTELYGAALADATKAITLDRGYVKGYYRRATSNMALGKFKLALKDYEYVTKMRPNDADAKMHFRNCEKIVKRKAFEKAISVDHLQRSIADSIDIESMKIEDDYSGPKLDDDGKVTLEFVKELIETFREQKRLHRRYAYKILLDIKALFTTLPSLVDIDVPSGKKFTICGDIHGQFYDLLNIFDLNGLPSEENPYLFNGDFVDRGAFSVECVLLLFSLKLLYPSHLFLSRGNHETHVMNEMYGFGGEVRAKYTTQMADLFTEIYNFLPLAHCINGKILVMHGGLFAEDGVTLDKIRVVERNRQPPDAGIMCDLLWADPMEADGRAPSKRGVSVQFGPDVTHRFIEENGLEYVVRSHEVKPNGYDVMHDGKCITVFSAPNYCDTFGNKGAFICISGSDLTPKYTTYEAVPHPNMRPMAYASNLFNLL